MCVLRCHSGATPIWGLRRTNNILYDFKHCLCSADCQHSMGKISKVFYKVNRSQTRINYSAVCSSSAAALPYMNFSALPECNGGQHSDACYDIVTPRTFGSLSRSFEKAIISNVLRWPLCGRETHGAHGHSSTQYSGVAFMLAKQPS